MRRVESYAALTPLLSAQLRRGVVTNCFLSPADYQREIDAGLFYEEREQAKTIKQLFLRIFIA